MLNPKLGIAVLLAIIFIVPSLATARPDEPQIQQSPLLKGDYFLCTATNITQGKNIELSVTVTANSQIPSPPVNIGPGISVFNDETVSNFYRRCLVRWFGQPDDVIGRICATENDPITSEPLVRDCYTFQ